MDYSMEELDLYHKKLTILPDLTKYINLKILKCNDNQITSLDNLPSGLLELYCGDNQIISLDNLPSGLQKLHCYYNKLKSLDNLPPELKILNCDNDEWKIKYFSKK